MRPRYEDIIEKVHRDPDTMCVVTNDPSLEDLTFKWSEHYQPEVDMDVDDACAVADQTLGKFEDVEEAEDETDFVDDLVGILGVYVVFEGAGTAFLVVLWRDLD